MMTTGPLLPAEAALLLEPSGFSGGKCLQAGLLTLLGREHLLIGDKPGIFGQRTLRLLDGDDQPLPPHLAVIKTAIASHCPGTVYRAPEVVKGLQKAFGSNFRRYIHDKLAPELIARGLLRREEARFLGLFPYIRYSRTALGEEQVGRLQRLMKEAGGMRKLIRTDPERAVRLAQAAGVLLILSPAARQQIPKLKELMDRRSDGGDGGGYTGIGGSDDESSNGWEFSVDFGDFSFSSDALDMFDGFDSVGDFTGGDGGGDGDGGGGD